MTNEFDDLRTPSSPSDHHSPDRARFGMVVLYVEDLVRSVEFYRLAGVDVSIPDRDRPVAVLVDAGATRVLLTTAAVARRFDGDWRPSGGPGYRQVVEFFVGSDAAVDGAWERLTTAGYTGITAPDHPNGPYATMVADPDGNAILLTHEPKADAPAT